MPRVELGNGCGRTAAPSTLAPKAVWPWRPLLWVLGCALVLRLGLVWAAAGVGVQIVDEQDYRTLAANIADGHGFGQSAGQPTSIRPPLYPAFIAAIWTLTGSRSLQVVRLAQVVVSLASALVLFVIARRLYDDRSAVLASALFAFYPSLLVSGVLILTETLFIFLLLLSLAGLLAVMNVMNGAGGWRAFGTGLCLGLAALTRSIMWPFAAVLIPFLWVVTRGTLRRRTLLCAALLAGYAVVIGPWAVRNTRLQRTLTIVDTMGGINLLTGNYEYTPEDRMWDAISLTGGPHGWDVLLRKEPHRPITEGEKDKWARKSAIHFMVEHPLLTLKRCALKLADLWGLEREWVAGLQRGLYTPPAWFAVLSSALVITSYPILVFLALAGFFSVHDNDRRARWLFALLFAFVCTLHAITFGHSRYHLPLVPILAIYAAAALAHASLVAHRLVSSKIVAPALIGLGCVAIWTREILFRDSEHIAQLLTALRHL